MKEKAFAILGILFLALIIYLNWDLIELFFEMLPIVAVVVLIWYVLYTLDKDGIIK